MSIIEPVNYGEDSLVSKFEETCLKFYKEHITEQVLRKYHFAQTHVSHILRDSLSPRTVRCTHGGESMGEREVVFRILELPQDAIFESAWVDHRDTTWVSMLPFLKGDPMYYWGPIVDPILQESDISEDVKSLIWENVVGLNTKLLYEGKNALSITVTDMGSSILAFLKHYESIFGEIKSYDDEGSNQNY